MHEADAAAAHGGDGPRQVAQALGRGGGQRAGRACGWSGGCGVVVQHGHASYPVALCTIRRLLDEIIYLIHCKRNQARGLSQGVYPIATVPRDGPPAGGLASLASCGGASRWPYRSCTAASTAAARSFALAAPPAAVTGGLVVLAAAAAGCLVPAGCCRCWGLAAGATCCCRCWWANRAAAPAGWWYCREPAGRKQIKQC